MTGVQTCALPISGAPGAWDYLGNVMDPVALHMDGFGFRMHLEGMLGQLRIYYVGRTFHAAWFQADEGWRDYTIPEIVASAKRGLATIEASPEQKLLSAITTLGPKPTPKESKPLDTNILFV